MRRVPMRVPTPLATVSVFEFGVASLYQQDELNLRVLDLSLTVILVAIFLILPE